MSKTTRGIVAAVIIAALVVGAVWYVTQQAPSTPPGTTAPPTTSEDNPPDDGTSERRTITFMASGFSPESLTVKAGETIIIKNDSESPVQFSSDDHPTHRKHPELNMRILQPGEQTQFTIAEPGIYSYHDHLDERHTGMIIVTI